MNSAGRVAFEVKVPKQVEDAAALAEELMGKPVESDPETPQDPLAPEAEVAPEAPEAAPSDTPAPQEDDIEELKKYKQRYDSLKGKYDVEVPRLHTDLRELKERVFKTLEEKFAAPLEPEVKPKETPAPAAANEETIARLRDEFGDTLVNGLLEIIKGETEPLKQTATKVVNSVESIEERQAQTAQTEFMSTLDQTVKGDWKSLWEERNAGEGKFAEFLASPDPSGLYTMGDLVSLYNQNWDSEKLAKVFNMYLETQESADPQTEAKQVPAQPTKAQLAAQAARDALIAPSRQNTPSETPPKEEKRIWTQATINEFKTSDRKGAFSAEDSKALWDDLLLAMSEGRIK